MSQAGIDFPTSSEDICSISRLQYTSGVWQFRRYKQTDCPRIERLIQQKRGLSCETSVNESLLQTFECSRANGISKLRFQDGKH